MDDMFGDLEKDDAQVIPISSHPEYKDRFSSPELMEGAVFDKSVDEHLTKMLSKVAQATKGEASPLQLEERDALGSNVCWQCTHRVDRRPWWKRILFTPNEMSYLCNATRRTEVADPVSGQIRWIELVRGMLGPQLILVDTPHRPCVELNPDGRCQTFNIALAKKKNHRKG